MVPSVPHSLLAYAVALGVLTALSSWIAPEAGRAALWVGFGGSLLALLGGLLGLRGWRVRGWALLTVATAAYASLAQVVTLLLEPPAGLKPPGWLALLSVLSLLVSLAMLLRLLDAGGKPPTAGSVSPPEAAAPKPPSH